MFMHSAVVRWVCVTALMLVSSCTPASDDASGLDCSTLSQTFFRKPTKEQIREFGNLEIEQQYQVYICGNQELEPPALYLANPFASKGASIVAFLKSKLSAAQSDSTINDIVVVFEYMSRDNSYDVAGDVELMKVIEDAVQKVKAPFWRQRCEQALSEIRAAKVRDRR